MASLGSSFAPKDTLLNPDPAMTGPDPSSSNFRFSPMNLFNVEGLIAVITGGGTGES